MDLHRVRRLRWQARAASPAQAFALRSLLREQGDACEAVLARAFDSVDAPHEVWRLPRLALTIQIDDVQHLPSGGLAARLESALRVALHQALDAAQPVASSPVASARDGDASARPADVQPRNLKTPPAGAASRRPTELEGRDALRHYLATGTLPWTLAGLAADQADPVLHGAAVRAAESVANGTELLDAWLPAISATSARIGALHRWLALLPAALRRRWLAAHAAHVALDAAIVHAWRDWIDTDAIDRIEWQALWLAGPLAADELRERIVQRRAGGTEPPFVRALWVALGMPTTEGHRAGVATAISVAPGARELDPPTVATARAGDDDARTAGTSPAPQANLSLLVPLAGLVLLHPWLPRLLAACGVLDDTGKQIDPALLPRACTLLHTLACGDGPTAEHQLPFIKLLLGSAPDEPLAAAPPALAATDQEEIAALLDAVRGHWRALQGTGTDGLRLSFLQRRGLLARGDGAWQLRVQSEPFDMLLGLLPWSIALVRLPWMAQPLVVDWPMP